MDLRTSLGKRLRTLRAKWGYTQQDISSILQIDRSTYAYYETSRSTPPLSTLKKLADVYHVLLSDLFGNEEAPPQFSDSAPGVFADLDHNKSHIYDLCPEERQLIAMYRLANQETRGKIMELLHTKNS